RVPSLDQEEIVEAGPVVLGLQIPVQVRDIPPSPHHRYGQDQQPEVGEMVPVKMPFQGSKKLVKSRGHAYDAEHGVVLLSPLATGRLHTLPSCGPRMASPPAAVKPLRHSPPKKSVNVSVLALVLLRVPRLDLWRRTRIQEDLTAIKCFRIPAGRRCLHSSQS